MSVAESNLAFIVAAYSVAWVVMLGYLTHLVRKGSRARSDYDRTLRDNSADSRL